MNEIQGNSDRPRPHEVSSEAAAAGSPSVSWSSLTNVGEFVRAHRLKLGYTSQEKFALEHGISTRVYQEIESHGQISKPNLYALKRHLRLTAHEWAQFHLLVTNILPSPGLTVAVGRTVGEGEKRVAADWAKIHLHRQENPSVMTDGYWNVEHFNDAWAKLFDSVEPHPYDHPLVNLLRFCLFHPDARRIYGDWENGWLMPVLCNFAHQYYLHPENPEFHAVRDRIRRNAYLEDLYQNRVARELMEGGTDRLSEGGVQERQLLLPGGETLSVLVTQAAPWFGRRYGYGTVTFSPADGCGVLRIPTGSTDATGCAKPASSSAERPGPEHDDDTAVGPATTVRQGPPPPSRKERTALARGGAEFALTVGQLLRHYREKTPFSQDQFPRATELPFSGSTYAKFERGSVLPKKEDVAALATALGMSSSVKRLLHWMVTSAEPIPPVAQGGSEGAERTRRWAEVHLSDDRQPSPSVLMDGGFNVVYCNSEYRRLFAHVPAGSLNHPLTNPFRYVVFHEDARQTLADWYEVWLVPWMVELGIALHMQQPTPHEAHQALYNDIQDDPFLRETFNRRVMRDLQGGGVTVGFESDGDIRGLNLPVEEGATERRHVPMLVTAGIPRHSRDHLFVTVTSQL